MDKKIDIDDLKLTPTEEHIYNTLSNEKKQSIDRRVVRRMTENYDNISNSLTDTYLGVQWSLMPVHGKIPCIKQWNSLSNEEMFEKLKIRLTAGCNLSVRTGAWSGITVVDVDTSDRGVEVFQQLLDRFGRINTIHQQTANGGFHYFFAYDEEIPTASKLVRADGQLVGIDVRNDVNGACVLSPSRPEREAIQMDC